ncbi:hypothetical protein LG275_13255 [Chryseomicrobium palamuruense]
MTNFCTKCGHKNNQSDLICVECGSRLGNPLKISEKINKGFSKKYLFAIPVAAIALFTFWGISKYSASNLSENFRSAIQDEDEKELVHLVSVQSGREIGEFEAEAFIRLIKENPYFSDLYIAGLPTNASDKFLGIFPKHTYLIDEYSLIESEYFEGLSYKLNGHVLEENITETTADLGNILAGHYTIESFYKDSSGTEHIGETYEFHIGEEAGGKTYELNNSFAFFSPSFELKNFDSTIMKDAKLNVQGQEYLLENGSLNSTIVALEGAAMPAVLSVNYPWGTVENELDLADSENLTYSLLSIADQKNILKLVETHVNEELSALINHDILKMTQTSDTYNDLVSKNFSEELYSSKLKRIDVGFNQVYAEDNLLFIPLAIVTDHAPYQKDSLRYSEKLDRYALGLEYLPSSKEWIISSVGNFKGKLDGATRIEGNYEEILPNAELIAKYPSKKENTETKQENTSTSTSIVNSNINNTYTVEGIFVFFNEFLFLSVEAINQNNYDMVSGLIHSNGPRGPEMRDYINYLNSKSITEKFHNVLLVDIEELSPDTLKVTTEDQFTIIRPGSEDLKTYSTVTILKLENGVWKVFELISTKEI